MKKIILFFMLLIMFALMGLARAESDRPLTEKIALNTGGSFAASFVGCHLLDHLIYGNGDQHAVNILIVGSVITTASISHNTYKDANGINQHDTLDIVLGLIGQAGGFYFADKLFRSSIKPHYDPYGNSLSLSYNF